MSDEFLVLALLVFAPTLTLAVLGLYIAIKNRG